MFCSFKMFAFPWSLQEAVVKEQQQQNTSTVNEAVVIYHTSVFLDQVFSAY